MLDVSRVQKELVKCNRDKSTSGVSIELNGDELSHLSGTISGPRRYSLRRRHLPDRHPIARHPNISSQNGAICLDILKDQWSPALTLKTALLSLQALLSAPESDDPQDAVVAQQYLRDYPTFLGTACYWTEAFAKRAPVGTEEKVQKRVEMGFPEALVRATLESVGGDENMVLEKLCSC